MHEMVSTAKPKYPRADAIAAARDILAVFTPACYQVIVAGSLRRRKPMVGDIEILFIPQVAVDHDLLGQVISEFALTDKALDKLIAQGVIAPRQNVNNHLTWGEKNKLAVHVASGIPVDFFRATLENWSNYLVCRTGPAESNVRIAAAAQRKGLSWHPYERGFTSSGHWIEVHSERDVFETVGLPYKEPWQR